MSFTISVVRRADDAFLRAMPEDVTSDAIDRWQAECEARTVYHALLGADGTVQDHWHVPARALGLPLLGALYEAGLRVTGAAALHALDAELTRLEARWAATDLAAEPALVYEECAGGRVEGRRVPLREHLAERLGNLRAAVRAALACDGILTVS